MKEFLRKFFGYYQYEVDGILGVAEPYKDELGMGAFSDIRHFVWIILVIVLSVLLIKYLKDFQKWEEQQL